MDLKKRIENFTKSEFEPNKDFYIGLKDGQSPHTLFIGCSDSRVYAETLLQAKAGEIFQIRNVANIVPKADKAQENLSVVSPIEYAVKVLKVKNIVVCAHSNCGGCAAIRKAKEDKKDLPFTGEWISQSAYLSDYVNREYPHLSEEDKLTMLEKLNGIQQMANLMTYDFVREKAQARELKLFAIYYDIATGEITTYDYDGTCFDCE